MRPVSHVRIYSATAETSMLPGMADLPRVGSSRGPSRTTIPYLGLAEELGGLDDIHVAAADDHADAIPGDTYTSGKRRGEA